MNQAIDPKEFDKETINNLIESIKVVKLQLEVLSEKVLFLEIEAALRQAEETWG